MRALRRYTLLGAPVLVVLASVVVLGPSPTSSASAVTTTARATIAHTAAPHVVAAHAATPHTVTPSASPGPYSPLNPVRICDTRAGNPSGLSGTADQCDAKTIAQGGTLSIDVAGSFEVPADATAAVLNVTAVHPVGQGYLTLYPAGSALPTASSLNVSAGAVVANLVEVRLGTGGQVSIFASTSTDVVIDLEGYVDTASAGGAGLGLYNPLPTPARICDTRSDSGLTGPAAQCTGHTLSAGGSLNVQVSGVGGVPASGVSAVVLNVTATNEASAGYLTVYPQGSARPTASNLNYVAGRTVPNRVIVPVSASGMISIFSLSQSDVVVDVSGWFSAAGGTGDQFVPTSVPTRICDTRSGSGLTGPAAQCTGRTLGPGATLSIQVSGLAGVPTGASAVVANVTAVSPSTQTYLTVFPSGTPPVVSDLNPGAGKVEPNLVVATLSSGGGLEIFNHAGSVNVVVDVVGWYQPVPPTISGVTPDTGAATGATPVTITGTNLTGASAVDFGSVSATFSVTSPTEISATSPAGTGTVDVTVTTAGGTSATSAADQFSYLALPSVTSVSPSGGPTTGGTVVTITGANLTGASAVDFGATAALSYEVDSDSQITATSPAGTGTVDVTVTGVNGPSATGPADDFTYDAVPIVTSVSPVSGSTAGGTSVTITGTNLTGASAVHFGSTGALSFSVNSATSITATSPAGTGTVDVTVTTPGGISATTSADHFIYDTPPSVTSVSPTSGPPSGGTSVTVTGANLAEANAVDFGTTAAASFVVDSATQITATSPAGTGMVDVTVTTAGGASAISDADQFSYVSPGAPVVSSVNPTSGPAGTVVTVTGTGFTGASNVVFGTNAASTFVVDSATQIRATAPSGAGAVNVEVTTTYGTSAPSAADRFTYASASTPVVSSISPNTGPTTGGTVVTVTGSGLSLASAVKFGTVGATNLTVISDAQITADAPAGTGTVDVTVTTSTATSATSSSDHFTYQALTGCSDTWTGFSSTDWSTGTNWSTGAAPGTSDSVCIPAGVANLPVDLSTTATVSTINNAGGLTIDGTLDLTGASSTSSGALTVDSDGVLEGSASVSVSGSLSIDGSLNGSGAVTVGSLGSLQVSGGQIAGGSLVNDGTGTFAANAELYVYAGGSFANAGSLRFDDSAELLGYQGTPSSESESGTTPAVPGAVLTNTGSINVTAAASYPATIGGGGCGYEECGTGLDDHGTITVSSGDLSLGGSPLATDTVDTGTVLDSPTTIDAGASVSVPAGSSLDVLGDVVLDAGGSVSATGPVTVDPYGTWVVGQNTTLPTLTVNGVLEGSASVSVSGSLSIDGSLNGSGAVTVGSLGSLQVSGGQIAGGSLVNDGTGTFAANAELYVYAGGSFANAGSLRFDDSSELLGYQGTPSSESESGTTPAVPGAVLTNTGSINVTAAASYPATIGGGGCGYEECGTGLDDHGTITVSSGDLSLGGSPLATDTVDTGTVLDSPTTIDAGASVSVPAGSSLDVLGDVVLDAGGSVSATGPVTVDPYGTWVVGQNTTLPTLTVNGVLEGSASVSVSGSLSIDGSLNGSGAVTVGSLGSLQVSGGQIAGGSLVNDGTGTFAANAELYVYAGGSFANAGSLRFDDSSELLGYQGTPSSESESGTTPAVPGAVLTNTGSINVTAAASYPATIGGGGCGYEECGTGLDDHGTITVSSGDLSLGGSPLATDTVDTGTVLDSPTTIDAGASVSVPAGSSLDVLGDVVLDAGGSVSATGPVTVDPYGTWVVGQNTTLPTLTVNGVLEGSASVSVSGSLSIDGSLNGSGAVTVGSLGSLQVSGGQIAGGSLVNDGTGTFAANAELYVYAGGSFANAGSLRFDDSSELLGYQGTPSSESESGTTPAVPGAVLTNTGSINVTAAASYPATIGGGGCGYEECGTGLDDHGTITVSSGDLSLGGSPLATDTVDTGTVLDSPTTIDAGASVSVPAGSSLDVLGDVVLDAGGSVSATGPVTVDPYGTWVVGQNTTLPTLTVNGVLEGSASVSVSGSLSIDGSLNGSGAVTVGSLGSLQVSGGQIAGGSLVNDGTGTFAANAELYVYAGGSFANAGSLRFDDSSELLGYQGTPSSESESGTTPAVPGAVLTNTGSINVTAAASYPATIGGGGCGYEECGTGLDDHGTITVSSGDLSLGGSPLATDTVDTGTVLDSPTTIDAGASVSVPAGSSLDVLGDVVLDAGGSVSATGPVTVDPYGTWVVGQNTTLPTLTVNGVLELAAVVVVHAGNLPQLNSLQLDASVPGQFGQLVVAGSVSLSGMGLELNATGYTPGCGTTVTAVRAGSVSSGFSSASGPTPPGGTWEATSTSTTAGAYIYCPPPPESVSETYGDGSSYDFANASGYQAEPVNTGTGAYSTTERDAQLSSIGVPFSFIRSYTSSDTASGPLGVGWTDSMNVTATASGTGSGSTVTIADENGQQVTYTESASGTYSGPPGTRSTLAALGGGGWTLTRQNQDTLTFNAIGDLVSEVDRNGVGLTLTYNGSNRLASVTDYAGHTVTFTYNTAGLLASMSFPPSRTVTYTYNPSNQLISVTDAAGKVTSYTYSSAGLLATVTDQNGHQEVANTYNSSGQVISQTNPDAGTATFSYDSADDTTTYTDPAGHQWQDVYQNGVLVERIDPTGGVTSFAYDSNLDLSAVTDPDGDTTTMTYDAAGNMTSKTSPLGITQSWTYDAMNDVTSYIDGKGNETTWSYNVQGDKTQMVLPGGATTTYTPDAQGLDTSITDPNGHSTTDAYNAAGQLTSVATPLGDTTTYTYDAAGRRLTMVDARGNATGATPAAHTTTYGYDAMDDLTSVTNPDGDTTTSTYDGVGNKTSVTDALGHTTTYGYDGADHLTTVTAPGGATTTTTYTYDANGNKASVTDALGHTTTYTYDADNRLTEVTDALGHTTTYGYDPDGRRTSVTDPDAAATTYTYDQDGRLTQISYSDSTPTVTYGYDRDDNRVSMTDGTGTTSYTYNDRNERTAVSGPEGTFTYTYDPDGNVTSRTYPDATVITYTYTEDDKVATMAVGSATTTFSYDPDDELTTVAQPNSVTETVTYDAAGQVASVTDTKAASPITSYSYSYDAAGNPTTVVADGQSDTYTYDNRNRLTSACYGASCASGQITYSYDADANRTAMTDAAGTTDYTYNAADELTATSGATSSTYSYNADGERTAAGSTTYAYNAAGELTSLTSGASTTAYAYNGAGDRVSATTGSSTTDYLYDPNSLVPTLALEETGSGTVLDRYTWADGLAISATVSGSTYYLAHDALGSVVGVTSASGTTEATTVYDPYGNVHSSTTISGAPQIPLGFEAELLDPSGLYHLGARQMDPTTGTFLTQDPLSEPALAPAVSPYLYAEDQPTTLWDPTGECADEVDQQISAAEAYGQYEVSAPEDAVRYGSQLAYDAITFDPTDPSDYVHIVTDTYNTFNSLDSGANGATQYASEL